MFLCQKRNNGVFRGDTRDTWRYLLLLTGHTLRGAWWGGICGRGYSLRSHAPVIERRHLRRLDLAGDKNWVLWVLLRGPIHFTRPLSQPQVHFVHQRLGECALLRGHYGCHVLNIPIIVLGSTAISFSFLFSFLFEHFQFTSKTSQRL